MQWKIPFSLIYDPSLDKAPHTQLSLPYLQKLTMLDPNLQCLGTKV